MKKVIEYTLGILSALSLILVLLVTAIDIVAFRIPGYYEREYTKYQVTADVNMEMADLLEVTDEMLDYLKGDRADLHVPTVVGGIEREFFNEREISHMEDVRGLILWAFDMRMLAAGIFLVCLGILLLLKTEITWVLPKAFQWGTGILAVAVLGLGCIFATDFTKYFNMFHEIFFSNDLWILDPATDLLINIVPEPFFIDTALFIGLMFGGSLVLLFVLCSVVLHRQKKAHRGESL